MKKYFLTSIITVVTLCGLYPVELFPQEQEKKDNFFSAESREKMNSYRVAFLTERLNLTPAEAEEFWPVYNEYRNKKEKHQMDLWKKYKIMKDVDEITPDLASDLIESGLEEMHTQYILKKEFVARLRTFFTDQRIIMLEKAEWDFKKELLNKLDKFKSPLETEK